MRKIILLLIMLMGFVGIIVAQTEVKKFQVHFKSDEYALDQTDKEILLDLTKLMQVNTYCEVVLYAHTDNDASSTYNTELSRKRALHVSDFLKANGVGNERISQHFFGESKPALTNSTAMGKAQNRRVEIALNYYSFENLGAFLKLIGGETKQQFSLKPNEDNTIIAKNGLKVVLPKGALETIDGKPVDGINISMEIEEFYTASEAATQQLSTISEGKILESGGMFSVKVLQGANELRLKDGMPLQVDMPSKNLQNNMQVFVPVITSQGITEWKATAQPFEVKPKKVVKLPFTKVDSKKLLAFKTDVDVHEIKGLEYLYKPLLIPKRPMPSRKQKIVPMVTKYDLYFWYERVFYSRLYMEKNVKDENVRRVKLNEKNLAKYQSKSAVYQQALAKYIADSASFETSELASFRDWLRITEVNFLKAKDILEQTSFNKGLERFCNYSDQEKLTSLNPKGVFISMSKPNIDYRFLYGNIVATLGKIEDLKEMSLLMAIGLHGNKQSQIFIGLKEQERKRIFTTYITNDYAIERFKNDASFSQIFDAAQIDVVQQREKLDLLDPNTAADKIYSATLSGFGVYNCDRFNTTPENQMAEIEIPFIGIARVSFYVPDINSFIYAYQDGQEKYHLKLPIGKQVRMIVLGFNEKREPLFQLKSFTITGNQTIVPEVKVSNIYEIRNSLSKI
ncbi:MAG: OmpA family protein [bacterium]|nr:OmpA family protein [bacterium]